MDPFVTNPPTAVRVEIELEGTRYAHRIFVPPYAGPEHELNTLGHAFDGVRSFIISRHDFVTQSVDKQSVSPLEIYEPVKVTVRAFIGDVAYEEVAYVKNPDGGALSIFDLVTLGEIFSRIRERLMARHASHLGLGVWL